MPTIAELILDALQHHGIDTLYCLPGVQNDDFFDALYDRRNAIKTIVTRHEQGAAYMALGAAQATGRPQAYCVVPGQGLLNASAAHATAFGVSARVAGIIGQIPEAYEGKGLGLLHELDDQMAILAQISQQTGKIRDPARAPSQIAKLMNALVNGDAKPIAFDVPMNRWQTETTGYEADEPHRFEIDLDAINAAADLLANAKNPMIIAGSGALETPDATLELASMLQAPVATYRQGRGVIDDRNPLSINLTVAHGLWPNVDVVLGLGTRMHYPLTAWGTDDELKIVQISTDPVEMTRRTEPACAINARCEEALPLLIQALQTKLARRTDRTEQLQQAKSRFAQEIAFLEPQISYLNAIRDALPDNGIFIDDITQVSFAARIAFPVHKPRTYISAGFPGTLGFGYAAALGAQNSMPGTPTIAVQGDGGFMFTSNELATAVQYNIPLTAIVFNDGAFGNVKRTQVEDYDNRTIASDLTNPDFVKYAESFGAQGLRAHSPDALRSCLEQAFKSGGPTVIDVPVGPMPNPWKHLVRFGGRQTADPKIFP